MATGSAGSCRSARRSAERARGTGRGWLTARVVAFSAGMLAFFLLAAVLTRMRGEGAAAVRFMLVMAVVFAVLLWLSLDGTL